MSVSLEPCDLHPTKNPIINRLHHPPPTNQLFLTDINIVPE
ncbi:9350_t:CDS:2 [Diversispora eburnea]|uniref:9350_t:CDS:1 n=1 Tax=Diversispora eburnea TaxID=1213867 RepID=A0A9N8UZM2_9GLOM|nr:9350_t:CDS:2 [Diversispora eburnea]